MSDLAQTRCDLEALVAEIGHRPGRRGGLSFRDGAAALAFEERMRAASNRSRNDQNRLMRRTHEDARAADVARHLASCGPGSPCLSGACMVCGTVTAEIVCEAIDDLQCRHPTPLFCVTIMHSRPTVPRWALDRHPLYGEFERKLQRVLDTICVPVIGGLEISYNEHHAEAYVARFVEHAHLFIPVRLSRAMRRRILDEFPHTRGVKRPLYAKPFDGKRTAAEYALKMELFRRTELAKSRPDGRRSSFDIRGNPMRNAERFEVLLQLHKMGPARRVFLHDCDLIVRRGTPRLMLP